MSAFPPKPDHSRELGVCMVSASEWFLTKGDSPIFDRLFTIWLYRSMLEHRVKRGQEVTPRMIDMATNGLPGWTSA